MNRGFVCYGWRRRWPLLLLSCLASGDLYAQGVCAPLRSSASEALVACVATANDGNNRSSVPTLSAGVPTLEEIQRAEAEKTSSPLFQQVKASIRTLDNAAVEAVTPSRAANPANVKRIELILSAADWEYLFSQREPTYTYARFLQAAAKFPALCGDYSDGRDAQLICRRTLATMFAHFAQETGGYDPNDSVPEWRQGLVHLRELGCTETGPGCEYNAECNPVVWQGQTWPCGRNADGAFKKYFGRGAKHPAWNRDSVFAAGNRVTHQNAAYEAKWWTQGSDRSTSGQWGAWRKLNDCVVAAHRSDAHTNIQLQATQPVPARVEVLSSESPSTHRPTFVALHVSRHPAHAGSHSHGRNISRRDSQ